MMRLAIAVSSLLLMVTVACSGDSGAASVPRTPVPLPTRTPVAAFGRCSPLAFARPVTYPIGQAPHSITVGDLNGDGTPDLVVTDPPSDGIVILLGDGTGGFRPAASSPMFVGRGPIAAVLADFTEDGYADVAVAHQRSGDVWLLVNDGAAVLTPAPKSPFAVSAGPTALAAGDFNRDGKTDLSVAFGSSTGSGVHTLLGDGKADFSIAPGSPVQLTSEPATLALDADDLDNDGILDLFVGMRETDTVMTLLGDERGGFRQPRYAALTVRGGPVAVRVGDLNGDGATDLATANSRSNEISVFLGDGKGGFSETMASPYDVIDGPVSLAVGDVNGDGKLDVMVVVVEADDITVLLGDGTGHFTVMRPPPRVITGGRPANPNLPFAEYIVTADLNADGKPDLVVANPGSSDVSVLVNACP